MTTIQNQIINAYYQLTIESHEANITVSDIINRSQTSRSTFYRYFLDKFDVMNHVFLNDFNQETSLSIKNPVELITAILLTLSKRHIYYQRILTLKCHNDFYNFLYHFISSQLTHLINEPSNSETMDILTTFASSAITYTSCQWIKSGQKRSIQKMTTVITEALPLPLKTI